ncbi:MAG: hypothetical protein QF385_14035, partial [SAR324 cluster bacterium]|nr:hypothetical protein [SAR324 cluster bacterium]
SNMPEQQLRYQNEDALILNGAVIKSQGSEVLIKLPEVGSKNSLSGSSDVFLDTTLPQGTSLQIKGGEVDTYSTSNEDIVTLSASDNFGINAYLLSDQGDLAPQSDNGSWVGITPSDNYSDNVSFVHLACHEKTGCKRQVFAWFRDKANNVSVVSVHDNTTLDTIVPTLDIISGFDKKAGFAEDMPGPYKKGDNLSLDFSFSEPVMADPPLTPKLKLSGIYSEDLEITLDNLTGEASHVVKGGDGTITVEVSGMQDFAGNAIDKTPVTIKQFKLDNTAPNLQSASLSSSNPFNDLTKPGDNLTLSVQSNETLQSVTMTVDGKEMVVQGSGTAWQGKLVTDQTIQEGNLNISVVLI